MGEKVQGVKHNWWVQNRQWDVKNSIENGEARELTWRTLGHDLRGGWLEGRGCPVEGRRYRCAERHRATQSTNPNEGILPGCPKWKLFRKERDGREPPGKTPETANYKGLQCPGSRGSGSLRPQSLGQAGDCLLLLLEAGGCTAEAGTPCLSILYDHSPNCLFCGIFLYWCFNF